MPIVINEFEAVAEGDPQAARRDDTIDRRPIEPQRVMPALARLHARARRTWAH